MGFVVGAVALVVFAHENPFADVAALILLGAAFLMRPRLGKPPRHGVVPDSEAPAVYALVGDIAASLSTPAAELIVVNHRYNASWVVVGLRRRRVLTLGLPLLTVLGPQERVALIAHELAQARNGDSARGLFVGSAVDSLAELYYLVAPEHLGRNEWELAFAERIANVFMYVVSRPVYWLLMLELHLLLRDSQRAEYLADALAASVAGTAAVVGLHEKLLFDSTFSAAVRASSHQVDTLFETARMAFSSVPAREQERRRRVARLEEVRLIATHPPTAKRIELLEARPVLEPALVLGEARSASIDQELAARRPELARRLVDEYRDSLYR